MTDIDNAFEPEFIPDEFLALCYLAEDGNADAQYEMGIRYLTGEDVSKSRKKASEFLIKAAEQGHEEAMNKLYEMAKVPDRSLWDEIFTIIQKKKDRTQTLYFANKYAESNYNAFNDFRHIDLLVELCLYKEALRILNRDYRCARKYGDELLREHEVIKNKIFEILPYVRKKKEKAPPKPRQPRAHPQSRQSRAEVYDERQLLFDFESETFNEVSN